MKLLVIRHGQSKADILNVHAGRADFELTELGIRQAQAMANWVAREYDVKRIYSSPLKRARQTAEQLAKIVGLEVQEETDLMEFNNGLLAGLTRAEANEKYPRVPGLPLHAAVYGQESALEFRFRAERVISRIIAENADDSTIAIFSHGGTINRLYQAFVRRNCTPPLIRQKSVPKSRFLPPSPRGKALGCFAPAKKRHGFLRGAFRIQISRRS